MTASSNAVGLLGMLRNGEFLYELAQALDELAEATSLTGKAGKVTATLSMKPAARGSRLQFTITDDIKSAIPKPEQEDTLVFRTDAGEFTRRDPRQPELPTMTPRGERVDTTTGEVSA